MFELDALMAEVAAEMRVILSEYVRINRAKRHFGASEASYRIIPSFSGPYTKELHRIGSGIKQGRFGNTRQSVTKSALLNIK